ncbi:MAG: Stk1 family PASTA domain-containing Ser/Thr kinase [Enterococcus sp.]
MLDIGRKINGRYQIIGNIGSGGMANVYLAQDLILDREVAVKVLRFDFQNDQTAIRRFQREALAASELVHPNIVTVYDVGEEDGMQYLVMEYVKGMDLKRFIKVNYPLSYQKTVDIMEQILAAISLAHQHRIIHRDMKPQNILINDDGVVKIADFGIAIALSETSLTQTNSILGSVHYLSPEQARGSMATNQSDLYAIGIIMYELLTGIVPFDGESAVTIALKHFQEEIPPVRNYDAQVPQSLENVVLHATAKDPADRYKTADEMRQDLVEVLSVERLNEPRWQPFAMTAETQVLTPIPEDMATIPAVEKEPPIEKVSKPPKKRRKWWLVILLLLLVGGSVFAAVFFSGMGNSEVTIPDLSGKTEATARQDLEDEGLVVADQLEEIASDEVDKDRVVKTDPISGNVVKKGSEVTLYLSSGSEKIPMKDYSEWTYEDARDDLKKLDFQENQIEVNREYSSKVEEGKIISQSPESGDEVSPKEDTVTLIVSQGVEPVTMPNLAGYGYNGALSELTTLGLLESQITVQEQSSDTVDDGLLISQTPVAGADVLPGQTTVTLTISTGPDIVTVSMLDVIGQDYESAVSNLTSLGISSDQITVKEQSDDESEAGEVISQSIDADEEVIVGQTPITLVVSTGPETVELEDLSGETETAAKKYLADNDLEYADGGEEASDDVAAGRVLRTEPGVGTELEVGNRVEIIYSTGPEVEISSSSPSEPTSSSTSTASETTATQESSSTELQESNSTE